MPNALQREIRQGKPFRSLEQEAMLGVERTAAMLAHRLADAFKAHGITATQYNVLRILRGAGADGLSRTDIRCRLVAQVPDVTRLIDRLEEAGLVERNRDGADRRVVTTRITREGLAMLDALDGPVTQAHAQQLGHMTATQLQSLIDLLALARAAPVST